MTSVYHRNVKSTNGIVRLGDSFWGVPGSNLYPETNCYDRGVNSFVHSIQENVEIHTTPDQTLRIFVRSFTSCVVLCIKTFCLTNECKSLPSALLTYTTQQICDEQSITRLLVVTCVCVCVCVCEAKEKIFSASF